MLLAASEGPTLITFSAKFTLVFCLFVFGLEHTEGWGRGVRDECYYPIDKLDF